MDLTDKTTIILGGFCVVQDYHRLGVMELCLYKLSLVLMNFLGFDLYFHFLCCVGLMWICSGW